MEIAKSQEFHLSFRLGKNVAPEIRIRGSYRNFNGRNLSALWYLGLQRVTSACGATFPTFEYGVNE